MLISLVMRKTAKLSQIFYKVAFAPPIQIIPNTKELNAAVDILLLQNINYFQGVEKIMSGASEGLGHVSSADPKTIVLDPNKIFSISKSQNPFDIALASAEIIGHEVAHVNDYDPRTNTFPGGEAVAKAEQRKVAAWIQQNMDNIMELPSVQQLL